MAAQKGTAVGTLIQEETDKAVDSLLQAAP
jgi:hypothetical protein